MARDPDRLMFDDAVQKKSGSEGAERVLLGAASSM
jgi:hypothetical protein